jgi:uncharacterized protein YecE (DUF72 family)
MSASLRLGTSSWGEKGWVGAFYPLGTAPRDFLSYYATCFDTVEADNTYYAVPGRELVAGWRRKTPEGFTLSAKFPRSIVHGGKGPRPDPDRVLDLEATAGDRQAFLESMAGLGPRCGPLVLQFPYFNRGVFAECGEFLDRLARYLEVLPGEFRYAVEVRNKGWYGEPLLELLRSHGVALVWVEHPYLPQPWRLAQHLDLFTADFVYARLIGDRKATDTLTKTFDAVVINQSENLSSWAELLVPARAKVSEVFAYANNHYAGHGPDTIRELARLLQAAEGS